MNLDYGGLPSDYVDRVRQFEGWNPNAYADGSQYSIGYGTKALYPGEVIDKAEGERRLSAELQKAAGYVNSANPNIPDGTRAALTSLTYNAGPGWLKQGLGSAVRAGDWDAARQHFAGYVNSGGQLNPGLVRRRQQELGWWGDGTGSPTALAYTGKTPMADNNQPGLFQLAQQQGQQPALFGGNPTPVGAFGALGRMLGIGTEDELGRRLQNAGAGLIAVGNPAGGAALQAAANMPHFNVVTDAYGNRFAIDTRTGRPIGTTQGGGMAPGANNQAQPQVQQQQGERPLSNLDGLRGPNDIIEAHKASQAQMEKLQEAASAADAFKDQNNQLMRLSQGKDIVQGPGLWNMIKDKLAETTNGAVGGVNVANQHAFSQGVSQLTGARLKLMGVSRIAQPEITFGAQGNASEESPAATNQQVFSNNIQDAKRVTDIRDIALKHYSRDGVLGPAYMAEVKQYIKNHPVHQDTAITPGSANQAYKILKVHPTE